MQITRSFKRAFPGLCEKTAEEMAGLGGRICAVRHAHGSINFLPVCNRFLFQRPIQTRQQKYRQRADGKGDLFEKPAIPNPLHFFGIICDTAQAQTYKFSACFRGNRRIREPSRIFREPPGRASAAGLLLKTRRFDKKRGIVIG